MFSYGKPMFDPFSSNAQLMRGDGQRGCYLLTSADLEDALQRWTA